jgi:transposase-like protein
VAEAESPGANISLVARRHQISRGLLSNWRHQVRRAALAAESHPPVFMPMQMLPEPTGALPIVPASREPPASTQATPGDRRIEIALPDGTCIRVGSDVGLAALRRVIAAARR